MVVERYIAGDRVVADECSADLLDRHSRQNVSVRESIYIHRWRRQLPQSSSWRSYQEKVAIFLSQIGFDTYVDETIRGARGVHDIDVTARMRIASVEQLWLIECKSWKRSVPKERLLVFRGVVEDIGADRGLLFSESGFQAGAINAAQNTNIMLTSLADFEENSRAEVSSARAKFLDERIGRASQAFSALHELPEAERTAAFARYLGPPGFPCLEGTSNAVIGVTARLSQMRQALEDARFNRWPVAYFPMDLIDGEIFDIKGWEGVLFVAENLLVTCERIYEHMINPQTGVTDWRDLQPPELTQLMIAMRTSSHAARCI